MAGVRLAFEPLHPMVCGGFSDLSGSGRTRFLDALNADDVVGLAVDSYAVWWDLDLQLRCNALGHGFCTFMSPTNILIIFALIKGMPGDG